MPLVPSSVSAPSAAPCVASVDAHARSIFEEFKVPGLAVAVHDGDTLAYTGYFGHADLEHDIAVTAQTRFRIGSLSKLLVVAAVARLYQDGKLDLDAPIHRYVPYFPKKAHPFSTRQLASHTAGIRHYAAKDPPTVIAKFLEQPPTWTSVQESLSIFMDDPLVFDPGTAYAYSTYGYNLISAVVEGASEMSFLETMKRSVVKPLGLRSTTADDWRAIIPHRTRFYDADPETGDVVHDLPVDNSYKWAGGGFLSSAEDLARFGSAFLTPGFLEIETLNEVFTGQPRAESRGFKVGLGWRIDQDNGRVIYHHGGAIAGGRSFILLVPEENLVVVLLANAYARFGKKEALEIAASWTTGSQACSS